MNSFFEQINWAWHHYEVLRVMYLYNNIEIQINCLFMLKKSYITNKLGCSYSRCEISNKYLVAGLLKEIT